MPQLRRCKFSPADWVPNIFERVRGCVRLKLWQQAALLVVVPLCLELTFIAVLYQALKQAEDESDRADYARNVAQRRTEISQLAIKCAGLRYFILRGILPGPIKMYESSTQALLQDIHDLEELVKADPEELARVKKLEIEIRSLKSLVDKKLEAMSRNDSDIVENIDKSVEERGKEILREITYQAERSRQAVNASSEHQRVNRENLKMLLLTGVVCSLALGLGLLTMFILTTGRRLAVIMDNVKRLGSQTPLNHPLRGNDELAELDHSFHRTERLLSDTARLREQLIAIASHELRSPLTSVDACLKMMLDGVYGELPALAKDRAKGAEQSLVRLIDLVNDLLDVERIQAGSLSLNPSHTELDGVIASSFEAVADFASTQGIDLRTTKSNLLAYVDNKRLLQVLVNLLSNAIKYSPRTSVVQVSALSVGESVEIRVQDTAPTISEAQRQVIFERFTTGDSNNLSALKGSGLGLAISRAIIDWHGGTIGVEGLQPQGNVFWFRVPVRPKRPSAQAANHYPDSV